MKSHIYKALLLAGMLAVNVDAISLYDTAPVVGLPQSHAIKYNVHTSVGYDTNQSSNRGSDDSSCYVNAGFGASYADFESVNKISYSFNLGMSHYFTSSGNGGSKNHADCGLSASMVHALGGSSTYSASLHLSYSPEPDYANGISSAHRHGDCLNWSFSNSYNESIDGRWSWNASAGYSGNIYGESEYSGDDRQYVSGSLGLSYRASELLSYTASMSYRFDMRKKGYDSENVTASLGFNRSLSPVSSCSGTLGLQTKMVHNKTILTPNLNLGYNRTVSEGLSVNTFLSLSNENVDTYRGFGANYLSDVTWRFGSTCSYRLSPDVSFTFGLTYMQSNYSKGTGRLQDETNHTIMPSVGMSYCFTQTLTGNINYQYTWYESDRTGDDGYSRHNISAGLQYSF